MKDEDMNDKIKYCKCGCGQEVESNKFFLKGHWSNNPALRPEVRKKISDAKKGHAVSKETREKISETFKNNGGHPSRGTTLTEEQKIKISIANKGKIRSLECRKKMSETSKRTKNFTGHKHSAESKKKMSIAKIGFKHSEETCMKMSKRMSGSRNVFWQGGISFEPYTPEFNKSLKKQIRNRDNNTCQHPLCSKQGKSFPVHHIDYNKKNADENNLITLCWSCHSKSNKDREFWQLFYEEIIDMKKRNLKYRIRPIIKEVA